MIFTESNVKDIIEYIKSKEDILRTNAKILKIWKGQLLPLIEDSLSREVSEDTFMQLRERIPPINVLKRIIDKVSRVYTQKPIRSIPNSNRDSKVLNDLAAALRVDKVFTTVNAMVNLSKYCGIEPYVDRMGKVRLRVIPADRLLAYTTSADDPLTPEVLIKFIGAHPSIREGAGPNDMVSAVILYSDSSTAIVDMEGNIRNDLAQKFLGFNKWVQVSAGIPIMYINSSEFDLVPEPDTDLLSMTVLFPKVLADSYHAIQYQSYSIYAAIDVDLPKNLKMRPNIMLEMQSKQNMSDKKGSIEVLVPKVDINQVLNLISATLIMWLESRHIKAGSIGKSSEQRASALAKIIDEADATQFRVNQAAEFVVHEQEFWPFLSNWIDMTGVSDLPRFSSMGPIIEVIFGDQMPLEGTDDRLSRVESMYNMGVMTPRQIIQQVMPGLSEAMIDSWMDQLEQHKEKMRNEQTEKNIDQGNSAGEQPNDQIASSEEGREDNQG